MMRLLTLPFLFKCVAVTVVAVTIAFGLRYFQPLNQRTVRSQSVSAVNYVPTYGYACKSASTVDGRDCNASKPAQVLDSGSDLFDLLPLTRGAGARVLRTKVDKQCCLYTAVNSWLSSVRRSWR